MILKPGELPVHQSPFYPRAMGRGFGYIFMPEVKTGWMYDLCRRSKAGMR